MNHLQVITCSMTDIRVKKILEFFAKQAYTRGLKYQLFLNIDKGIIIFVLYAHKIFDIKLNIDTVKKREQLKNEAKKIL